jgi:hypothetical protein
LVLATSLTTSSLRWARIPGRLAGVAQQRPQIGVAFVEGLGEPRHARDGSLQCGGVSAKVCASTDNEPDSWSVFSPLMVADRSPSASGS